MPLLVAFVIAGFVGILLAITGGNFESQWLKIGKISTSARVACGVLGSALVLIAVGFLFYQTNVPKQQSQVASNPSPAPPSTGPIKSSPPSPSQAAPVGRSDAATQREKPERKAPKKRLEQVPIPAATVQHVQPTPATNQQCIDGSICNAGGTVVQAPQTIYKVGPPRLQITADGPFPLDDPHHAQNTSNTYTGVLLIRTNTEWSNPSFEWRCDGGVSSFEPQAPQIDMLQEGVGHISWDYPPITPKRPMRILVVSSQPITKCFITPDP